jgi:hypothetical protein
MESGCVNQSGGSQVGIDTEDSFGSTTDPLVYVVNESRLNVEA